MFIISLKSIYIHIYLDTSISKIFNIYSDNNRPFCPWVHTQHLIQFLGVISVFPYNDANSILKIWKARNSTEHGVTVQDQEEITKRKYLRK